MTATLDATACSSPEACKAVWVAFMSDTACAVAVCDQEGVVQFANGNFEHRVARGKPVSGRSLRDILPAEVGTEQVSLLKKAISTDADVHVEGLIGGVQMVASYRPFLQDGQTFVVATIRPSVVAGGCAKPAEAPLKAANHDKGVLEKLTARETEVLRLIGMGLSTANIAKELHRSVKTIEWHRVSLGSKLGVTNRVELARIAINAGISQLTPAVFTHSEAPAVTTSDNN